MDQRRRYIFVLDKGMSSGQAMNVAGHLAAQLGAQYPAIAGEQFMDASGTVHAGLPNCSSVVLAGDRARLRSVLQKARKRAETAADVFLIDFPEQGLTTATDEELRMSLQGVREVDIQYLGLVILGPKNVVGRITKGCTLWQDAHSPVDLAGEVN